MPEEVIIEIHDGWIVFSCPLCSRTGVFSPWVVQDVTEADNIRTCPICWEEVLFDPAKMEGTVHLMMAENPSLNNPLEVEIDDEIEVEIFEVARPTKAGGEDSTVDDLIVVVDSEETYRADIEKIFSGIAVVEAYGGAQGADAFIVQRAESTTLVIMDVYLGDGTFMDILNSVKSDDRSSQVPVILVYPIRKDKPVIEEMAKQFPQVKRIIHKEDLLKRLAELSEKLPKKG
jgi:PleD family two-component response regulator